MVQANKQIARELLQSQENPLDAFPVSRRVVSLGISTGYVKDCDTRADAFRELFQNWYVLTDILLWTSADLRRKMPSWKDSSLTVRASRHS
jgi:hypothetical protein